MKRKITAVFLLACLLMPALATFGYLQHQKYQVRKEVKHRLMAGIDKSELVLLKFTERQASRELEWEHSREFEYRGEMYDVVERAVKGDTLYFWCWWDHKETALNKKLSTLVQNVTRHKPERQEQRQFTLHFYSKWFFQSYQVPQPVYFLSALKYRDYHEPLTRIYLALPEPVPRLS